MNSLFGNKLILRDSAISPGHVLKNSKADSGGDRDLHFINYLFDNGLLGYNEAIFKRTETTINEEFYLERYKKMSHESDRHFLCRVVIQRELMKLDIETYYGHAAGDMNLLRENGSYDIVFSDFSCLVDVGLTPARNYFRGLTDIRTTNYMITSYFDDYTDELVFFNVFKLKSREFIEAVRDYEEGFKPYMQNANNSNVEDADLYRFI